jgi:UDP-N-acetylmuramoyl-tripeptide--D-alanyl-D-alanine ligase
MRSWSPQQLAEAAGATLVVPSPDGVQRSPSGGAAAAAPGAVQHQPGPDRASIDSRDVGPGVLFVGLPGERVDGGRFAGAALAGGAWGVLVAPEHAEAAAVLAPVDAVVLAAADPLLALQQLATAWRRALGARVIGITGSTGKTSTKDVLAAMLRPHRRTVATRENFNTEIGLPLTVLAAPPGTEVLVLEMAMRGAGQIAELARIAEPDVGLITNVGPVHVELLGSVEGVAAAKAELIAGLAPGATLVLPAVEPLLEPHLRDDLELVRFGEAGDVTQADLEGLELPFSSAHMLLNATAALAAARAIGVTPAGRVEPALSAMRGQLRHLPGSVTVVEDCYNANPMSMRAALDDLQRSAPGRRVAVLGDMRELGPDAEAHHVAIGEHARAAGVDLLVTVGPLARAMGGAHAVADAAAAAALVPGLVEPGDTVLVKASRGVGLEAVVEALAERAA